MNPKHHVEPLITEEEIQTKITELAKQIAQDYAGRELVIIGVLHGGAVLLSDLGRALWRVGMKRVYKDYIGISSYGSSLESSGEAIVTKELKNPVENRDVLIVEDIVDTGRSMTATIAMIKKKMPASIATMALLSKPSRREVEVKLDYVGFEIPNKFVVGYDLDYEELYRTMPDIGVVVFE